MLGITVSPAIHDFRILGLLSLIFLVRWVVAVTRTDMIWPDEHFQTLEPAFGIVHGFWYRTWEWEEGFRSWIPPALFVPLFFALKFFGVNGGSLPVIAARFFCGVISLGVPFGLNRIGIQLGWSRGARYGMLLAFLAHGMMALWGVAPLTDSLSTAVLWSATPLAWEAFVRGKGFRAGFLAALPFLVRPHLGIFALAFGLFVILRTRAPVQILRVAAGGLTVGFIYGGVDTLTWGVPFQSLILQFGRGVKLSETFGVEPWFAYFSKVAVDQGGAWLGVFAVAAIVSVFAQIRDRVPGQRRDSVLPVLAFGAVLFFTVHSLLPHKETRFIEPVFPLFFLAVGSSLDWVRSRLSALERGPVFFILGLIAFSIGLSSALARPLYLTSVEITPLFDRIYREEQRGNYPRSGCLLMIDHNWGWSRGALGIGREWLGVDRKMADVRDADFRCGWVIAPESQLAILQIQASSIHRSLRLFEKLPNGFLLLR